jgi:predicted AAA+ superfamily ATPase
MIRALTLNYENDLGRLFENVIYLDLRRQGYKIYYYLTAERYEVDFLIQTSQGQKKLSQVAWDMADPDTFGREERALKAAQKELKIDGKIITLESYLREGVQITF